MRKTIPRHLTVLSLQMKAERLVLVLFFACLLGTVASADSYYKSGSVLQSSSGAVYYADGGTARSTSGTVYYEDGSVANGTILIKEAAGGDAQLAIHASREYVLVRLWIHLGEEWWLVVDADSGEWEVTQ